MSSVGVGSNAHVNGRLVWFLLIGYALKSNQGLVWTYRVSSQGPTPSNKMSRGSGVISIEFSIQYSKINILIYK